MSREEAPVKLKTITHKVKHSIIATLTLYALQTHAGHFTGNGGDHVRAMFFKMGESVISFLKETQEGQKLLSDKQLALDSLKNLLSIEIVSAVEIPLIDNGGSSVDAIGEKGKITLNKNRWIEHLEKERDVYYLVFHEMLRALQINDDNYIVSKALLPFPKSRVISTKMTPLYPLINSERLDKSFILDQLSINGSGCPQQGFGTRVDFDKETNQLDISFEEYNLTLDSNSNDNVNRKNCSLTIPVKLPENTRLVVTQMDMQSNIELSLNSNLNFGGEVFFSGDKNVLLQQTVTGTEKVEKGRSLLRKNSVLKSACGGTGNLRANTFAVLKKQNGDSTLKTKAAISDFKLSFKLESCQL